LALDVGTWADTVGPVIDLNKLRNLIRFAWRRGYGWRAKKRLFTLALRPSLVHRGWAATCPRQTMAFDISTITASPFRVHVRDNLLDFETVLEILAVNPVIWPESLELSPPAVIYDIGANIGIMSLFLAAKYPQARIFGFEPLPSNWEICRLNYQNLKRAEVFPWAVGSSTGKITFEFSEADIRGGRIGGTESECRGEFERKIEVPVFSIDDLVAVKGLPQPDFLKIDVEGAELEVLKGARRQVASLKTVHLETHGRAVAETCRVWMQDLGFRETWRLEVTPGLGLVFYQRR
jgi:FkbM family methyltransferase